MKQRILIILLIGLIFQINSVFGQDQHIITESKTHIYWQSDRKLSLNDYQGKPGSNDIKNCEEKGSCVAPCLGLFVVVDVPRNHRKNKLEKVYYAPAFEKACSFVVDDSVNIHDGQIIFDIMELSSRIARKLLRDTHNGMAYEMDTANLHVIRENPDTILITGIGASLAGYFRDSAMTFYNNLSNSYLFDMYLSTESKGYESWRILVDDWLEKYELYATKSEECYRAIRKQPILPKYKQAYK